MAADTSPDRSPALQQGCDTLRSRLDRAARRTIASPIFLWDWGEAIAIQALLCASDATNTPAWRDWAFSRMDLWRQIHPQPFWPDHLGPGFALVRQFEITDDPAVLDYAERLAGHLMGLPVATTGARLLRPDKPDIDHFVWVDSLYTDGPFLCALGRATGNFEYIDEGIRHTLGLCTSLQDAETGLFTHRYDDRTGETNGVYWGRGCGWAALGLGLTLNMLPPNHPRWEELAKRMRRFAAAVTSLQESSGYWRAVIDQADTLCESSTTALIAEGLSLGLDAGALDASAKRVVDRAWDAVCDEVDDRGVVQNVSQRSPSSPDWRDYKSLPHGGCYAWGQGPWLALASRFLVSGHGTAPLEQPTRMEMRWG